MRATLRANSSTSGEPPLTGSDGALTATPQFGFRRRPALAFRDRRWTLLITAARRIIGLCPGACAGRGRGRASPAKSAALTLLWSYCRNTSCSQLLELAAILPRRGGADRGVDVAIRPGSNRHDVDLALTTARAEARPCGGARRGCPRSRGLLGRRHGRRSPAKRGRRLARRHPATPDDFDALSGGPRHAAPACDHGAHRRGDEKARKRSDRGAQPCCCGSRR